ncbi:hypothetical protein WJX73_000130 [Symbiochloris irregularis]|uniref:Uncharacterized protein n=1 Tax=Symbiochloris irregularis TaxID=706552 RepID=A0AAW1P821_9CHLO
MPPKKLTNKRKRAALEPGSLREPDASADDWSDNDSDTSQAASDSNTNESHCTACGKDSDPTKLLCCDSCPKVYHLSCLDPPLKSAPRGEWHCQHCSKQHSVQQLERILASRPQQQAGASGEPGAASVPPTTTDPEYYVKWKDRSYLHCSWIPYQELMATCKKFQGINQRFSRWQRSYKMPHKDGSWTIEPDIDSGGTSYGVPSMWVTPQRVIAWRERGDGRQYLVKWEGLGYDQCTWEGPEDLPGPKIEELERRAPISGKPAKASRQSLKRLRKAEKQGVRTFLETPSFLAGGALHSYQLEGLNWLLHAWEQHQNVILADEMGLGKTIQTIGLLATLAEQSVPRPHLVVVPLSTLPNWEREFATWAPQLNVVVLHGTQAGREVVWKHEVFAPPSADQRSDRQGRQSRVRIHVLLTSYESVLLELTELKRLDWEVMIVDEGHRLKNRESRLFQALIDLKVQHKVLLTGTPLQNRMAELFMLMHFLDPDRFASLEEFEAEFLSISHNEQVAKLHALLAPHLLRRYKRDVLRTLPPKREQIVRVDLAPAQKRLYKSILTKSLPTLSGREGRSQTRLGHILMDLRKCCNHPLLLDDARFAGPSPPVAKLVADSGKLRLLDRMLAKLRAEGHRTLIYSQFTMVLDLLEDWLLGRNWGYQRIDGSVGSSERQARIDRFNRDDGTLYPCFLLSTRAGGLGINLATADTVVIFDSDWNPHNDLQAQSRAHRLGQEKPVMVYRLVCRATVEERMMQQSKRKLMMEHVIVEKMGAGADLRQDELDDLLRYGAAELFADAVTDDAQAAAVAPQGPSDKAARTTDDALPITTPPDRAESAAPDAPEKTEAAPVDDAAVVASGETHQMKQLRKQLGTNERAGRFKTVRQQEEEAGRLGGGGGRAIVWDNAAIGRLLDRSALSNWQESAEQEAAAAKETDFMKAFKVAHFTLGDHDDHHTDHEEAPASANTRHQASPDAASGTAPDIEGTAARKSVPISLDDAENGMEAAAAEEPVEEELGEPLAKVDKRFWESLLGAEYEDMQALTQAAMGKGKRTRKAVNYTEMGNFAALAKPDSDASDFSEPSESEPSGESAYEEWKRRKRKRGASPLPGNQVKIVQAAPRAATPNGAPAQPGSTAAQANQRTPPSQTIRPLSARNRAVFMDILMRFGLGERTPDNSSYRFDGFYPHFHNYMAASIDAHGRHVLAAIKHQQPRDEAETRYMRDLLCSHSPQEVLVRLGMIHLIRQKLKNRVTDRSFLNYAHMPQTKVWGVAHDKALLMGILKHGYGCWSLIVRDEALLDLMRPLQAELDLTIPREAVQALQNMSPLAARTFAMSLEAAKAPGQPAVEAPPPVAAHAASFLKCFLWVFERVKAITESLEEEVTELAQRRQQATTAAPPAVPNVAPACTLPMPAAPKQVVSPASIAFKPTTTSAQAPAANPVPATVPPPIPIMGKTTGIAATLPSIIGLAAEWCRASASSWSCWTSTGAEECSPRQHAPSQCNNCILSGTGLARCQWAGPGVGAQHAMDVAAVGPPGERAMAGYRQLQATMAAVRDESAELHRQVRAGEAVDPDAAGRKFRKRLKAMEDLRSHEGSERISRWQ